MMAQVDDPPNGNGDGLIELNEFLALIETILPLWDGEKFTEGDYDNWAFLFTALEILWMKTNLLERDWIIYRRGYFDTLGETILLIIMTSLIGILLLIITFSKADRKKERVWKKLYL